MVVGTVHSSLWELLGSRETQGSQERWVGEATLRRRMVGLVWQWRVRPELLGSPEIQGSRGRWGSREAGAMGGSGGAEAAWVLWMASLGRLESQGSPEGRERCGAVEKAAATEVPLHPGDQGNQVSWGS